MKKQNYMECKYCGHEPHTEKCDFISIFAFTASFAVAVVVAIAFAVVVVVAIAFAFAVAIAFAVAAFTFVKCPCSYNTRDEKHKHIWICGECNDEILKEIRDEIREKNSGEIRG